MTDSGTELNRRVWKLFEKAGFQTKPSSNSPVEESVTLSPGRVRTVDLLASLPDLNVKIIGENTTASSLDESFTFYIHDISQLRDADNANGVLFVLSSYEISNEDRRYAEQNNIQVWGEQELRYYEAVVEALGTYAKYEIIHSFRLRTNEETNIYNVLALKFQQPYTSSNTELFMFTITPEKLLKTCVIYRRAQGSGDAYQRMVRKSRLGSVKNYVTRENAVLPPNIIVHLGNNVTWHPIQMPEGDASGNAINLSRESDYELGVLNVPLEYASIELIDGQHRLYGFVGAEPATREHFNLSVVGLKNLDTTSRRDIFVAINDNMRRVDPNLVTYLKYTPDESECQINNALMAINIVVELNKTSPFRNKIKLLDIGDQIITLRGFSGYELKSLLGPRGLLRRYYPENESREYISALRLYFGILKSLFGQQWDDPRRYIIFTNRGISAFLKLLKSILKNCQSPIDADIVRRYLQPIKDRWQDWDIASLRGEYTGSGGWNRFHRDLVTMIRQDYPDFRE